MTQFEELDNLRIGVSFYKHILRHKNPKNKPYPISRLIGHRSHASKNVQHVAKTVGDLKQFFLSIPHVFTVTNDNVTLVEGHNVELPKKAPPKPPESGTVHNSEVSNKRILCIDDLLKPLKKIKPTHVQNIGADNLSNQNSSMDLPGALMFYFCILLVKSGIAFYPLVKLIGHRGTASIEIQSVAKNPKTLKQFLGYFPDIFQVNEKFVKIKPFTMNCILFLTYCIEELSKSNDDITYKMLISNYDQPLDVEDAFTNASEIQTYLSKYADIFIIKENSLALKDIFSNLLEMSKPYVIERILFEILRKEVQSMKLPSNSDDTGENSPRIISQKNDITTPSPALFFLGKLWEHGLCRVIAIDELFKFKCKAPREIQAACGNNVQEFRNFLCQYPESFIVTDENVLARRNFPRKKWTPALRGIEEPVYSLIVNFFKSHTQNGQPVRLDTLYSDVGKRFFRNDGRLFFENSKELEDFLNMFPQFFYIYDKVVINIMYHGNTSTANNSVSLNGISNKRYESNVPIPPNEEDIKWKEKVLQKTKFVNSKDECQAIINQLKKEKIISLDCEGLNLGSDGVLSLIQIAKESGEVYVFDILHNSELLGPGLLKDILESKDILKVIHDVRNDGANLYYQFGVILKNIFDTRVADSIITNPKIRKFKNVSFNYICEKYGGPINIQKKEFKNVYKQNPGFWLKRPLDDNMLAYASLDVACLVPRVYNAMKQKLIGLDDTVLKFSQQMSTFYIK